jgi:hypothetical protein
MTYLRADGTGKAGFDNPEFQLECRGVICGGTIRLAPLDPKRELLIGEGLECSLSAMKIFDLPVWSAVSASVLRRSFDLPLAALRIVIAADNDDAERLAAAAAQDRWRGDSAKAHRVVMPRTLGYDFNDVLLRGTQ